MRRFLLELLLVFMSCAGFAQRTAFELDLWSNGFPNSNGIDKNQPFDDSKQNFKPSIKVFLPEASAATGRAVVDFPGGGYGTLALEHEGYEWAPFYNKLGIALIVVKYRMPMGNADVPYSDACRAMRIVKDSAEVWNINPNDIGVMGSSAGGHLASTVATHTDRSIRPAFQILFYPVISMDKSITHAGSRNNLLGKEVTSENEKYYSNDLQVNRYTPTAYITLSDDDLAVNPLNAINYYSALKKQQIPASLYIYPSGNHGWGYNKPTFAYHQEQQKELADWLKSFAAPKKDAIRVACIGNSITYGSGISNRLKGNYPAQLGNLLGNDYWVSNFGVSGHTMLMKGDNPYMKSSSWKEALSFNPNIVIIKLGTNDSKPKNWAFKDDYEKDMQTMIDSLKNLSSKPKIYLSYPAKAYNQNFTINDSVIVNEVIPKIQKIAKKNKLTTIDMHAATDGHADLFPDGIHPNEKGAAIVAKTVSDVIENYKEPINKKKLSEK